MNRPTISRVWQFHSADTFQFPENDPKYADFFAGKEPYGFCFSGGGTRAAVCAIGQLRGLHSIGVLQKARYVSSNSGGTWGVLPYIYLNEADPQALHVFFGTYTKPEIMTVESICQPPAEGSFIRNATESHAPADAIGNRFRNRLGDESFSQAIAKLFLTPHNIGYEGKMFSLNQTSVDEIRNYNEVDSTQFVTVTPGRPFHIANGTLHNRFIQGTNPQGARDLTKKYHVEFSPLYAGVRVFHPGLGDFDTNVGGGYLEPFAFDSNFADFHSEQDGIPRVKIEYPSVDDADSPENEFTLADVMGISGSALTSGDVSVDRDDEDKGLFRKTVEKLGSAVAGKLAPGKAISIIKGYAYLLNALPEANHFSPHDIGDDTIAKVEYNVGDGGPVDDLGLMPLLARRVPRIICFCNVQYKIIKRKKFSTTLKFDLSGTDPDVLAFFGLKRKFAFLSKIPFGPDARIIEDPGFQQVFRPADFNQMKASFEKAYANGEPLIHEGIHTTIANPHFGIEAGVTVKILWIYNDRSMNFENKLSEPLRVKLRIGRSGLLGSNRLKNFPNFATFAENRLRVVDMFPEQVNLLANYQTWIVKENESRIRQFLSG